MLLCKDCDYCMMNLEHGNLECRFNPPQLVAIPGMTQNGPAVNVQSLFPLVTKTGWCSKGGSKKEEGGASNDE